MILLARALIKSPELLLMDEAYQGQDTENCERLTATLSVMSKEKGIQVILVTHRRNEIPSCIPIILS
jgi:molybdate transport system ATP-binding protein